MRFFDWLFNLFDRRSTFEKEEDERLIQSIIALNKTHHIIVGKRGGIRIIEKKPDDKVS